MNYLFSGFRKYFTGIFFGLIFIFLIGIIVILPMHSKSENKLNDYFYTQPHGLLADYYYYLSIINEGKIQSWETDPYTTEPHTPSQVHIYYIWLGKIAAVFNLSVIEAYYVGLFVPLVLYCLFTYLLVSYFFPNLFKWVALGIIFFTGPFPQWTVNIFGKSIFLGTSWWTKMDPYSRLTNVPHHFFSSALVVGTVYFYLKYLNLHQPIWAILCSLSLVLGVLVYGIPVFVFFIAFGIIFMIEYIPNIKLGIFRDYIKDLFLGCHCEAHFRAGEALPVGRQESRYDNEIATPLERSRNDRVRKSYILLKKTIFWKIIIGLSFAIPFLLVYFQLTRLGLPWSLNLFWEYQVFRAENYPIVFSFYLFNFGILLPFSLPAIPYVIWKRKTDRLLIMLMAIIPFVLWWLVVLGILHICKIRLIYTSPYVFMGLLTSFVIYDLYKLIKPVTIRNIFIICCLSLLILNAYLSLRTYWSSQLVADVVSGNIYLHQSYLTGFKYLNETAKPNTAVFSDFYMGMLIPVFSHTKTYIGHEVATLDYHQKRNQTEQFFAGQLDSEDAKEIFDKHQIEYIYWDKCYYPMAPVKYDLVMAKIYETSCAAIYKAI